MNDDALDGLEVDAPRAFGTSQRAKISRRHRRATGGHAINKRSEVRKMFPSKERAINWLATKQFEIVRFALRTQHTLQHVTVTQANIAGNRRSGAPLFLSLSSIATKQLPSSTS